MKLLLILGGFGLLGAWGIWYLDRLLNDQAQSRTSAMRELMERVKAEAPKGPAVKYRQLDPRHKLKGRLILSRWEEHQAIVQERLRKRVS